MEVSEQTVGDLREGPFGCGNSMHTSDWNGKELVDLREEWGGCQVTKPERDRWQFLQSLESRLCTLYEQCHPALLVRTWPQSF